MFVLSIMVSIIDVNNDFQYDQNNRDTILNNVSLIKIILKQTI